jgi:hypothetical protein
VRSMLEFMVLLPVLVLPRNRLEAAK